MGESFTEQVASELERTSQVGGTCVSRGAGVWEVLLERAQWGLLGIWAAEWQERGEGGRDAAGAGWWRLGQVKRPELHSG